MIKPTVFSGRSLSRLALLTFTAISLIAAPAARAAGNPYASGHSTIFFSGLGTVAITFAGVQHKDGTVSGNATIQSLTTTTHADINCLRIVGNTAFLSGVITKSDNGGFPEGSVLFIRATDNGEGNNAPPDLLDVYGIFAPGLVGTDCDATLPMNTTPVLKGNVQVNDGTLPLN